MTLLIGLLQQMMLDNATPKLCVSLSPNNGTAIKAAGDMEYHGLVKLESSDGQVATYILTHKGAALRKVVT